MKRFLTLCIIGILVSTSAAYSAKNTSLRATINLALTSTPQANRYANLEYGIRVNVRDDRANQRIVQVYDGSSTTTLPDVQTNPGIMSFVPESARRYMRTMGFNLDADVATDYLLQMTIQEFHVDYLSGVGWTGTVILGINVSDHTRQLVYPNVDVEGRASVQGAATNFAMANAAMNQAYANALADVDWDRIAFFLHKKKEAEVTKTSGAEKEKQIAAEQEKVRKTPIFWGIDSRPAGADIYWRVSSSTDEVKNQNSKYLGTTQYEATETLNIKGLTFDNASQVEIVIKCEKDGYGTQTKKVNVSSALDEKEILMFFKLNKLEE